MPKILQFDESGTIELYSSFNEYFWAIEGDCLNLFDKQRNLTTSLKRDLTSSSFSLIGNFVGKGHGSITHRLYPVDEVPFAFAGSTQNALKDNIDRYGWEIGKFTYGNPTVAEPHLGTLRIGKFCSIAGGVSLVLGNHQTEYVSTYPFASLRAFWPSLPQGLTDHVDKGKLSIGNDVWIGTGAIVLPGVTIGDGAVIAAHCVVTKSIPPYAIVAGNPGRIIRFRFTETLISELLVIRWWDWPDAKIMRNLRHIMSKDIAQFINTAKYG